MHLHSKVAFSFFFLLIQAATVLAAPQINSEAAYLINVNNNQVLYEKNGDKLMYPASTTKIMTALVALKHGDLDSIVTVKASSVGVEGSSLNLKVGDQLTLRDLLRGMMAVSGNDAAQAVAEHVGGGSSQVFINWMNEQAVTLGAAHTHFSNPHGLPDPSNQYTTAHDLAIITAYAYKQPGFVDYVNQKYQTIRFINRGTSEREENINELLGVYPGCNGVKTGTTREAGECLVAAAKRNEVQLIAVMLKSSDREHDAAKMLDYGFQQAADNISQGHTVDAVPQEKGIIKGNSSLDKIVPTVGSNPPSTVRPPGETIEKIESVQPVTPNQYNTKIDPDHLLGVSAYGGGSIDAAYLSKSIFGGVNGYIGPAVKYDSNKKNKVTVGIRLTVPTAEQIKPDQYNIETYSCRLLEISAYGDGSADVAYLTKIDFWDRAAYIGPAVKYDPKKTSKISVGVRLTMPI